MTRRKADRAEDQKRFAKEWRDKNPEKAKAATMRYRKSHPEVLKAVRSRYEGKARENVTDWYAGILLSRKLGIPRAEVPEELIDIQRGIVILKRLLQARKAEDEK